jgi:hypothetical protein
MTKARVGQLARCLNIEMTVIKVSKNVIVLKNVKNKKETNFKPDEFYRTYRLINGVWMA